MVSKRDLRKQMTDGADNLAGEALKLYRFQTRRFAVWNRRAVLLKAKDKGVTSAERSFINQTILDIESAFQILNWEEFGDATAQLDPIAVNPSAEEIKALAEANNAAVQKAETVNAAQDFLQLGTTFLNIANGQIPA